MKFFKETVEYSTLLARLPCCVAQFAVVGSAAYADDPKDLDILVLLPVGKTWADLIAKLEDNDKTFSPDGNYDTTEGWHAFRRHMVNLIVCDDAKFYDGMKLASEVCAALRLERKTDRVRVHRVIRDGMTAEQAREAPMREGVTD